MPTAGVPTATARCSGPESFPTKTSQRCSTAPNWPKVGPSERSTTPDGTADLTYVEQAARQGLVGLMTCDCSPRIVPHGGSAPVFGTNPIAAAVPADPDPILLDLSKVSPHQDGLQDLLAAAALTGCLPEEVVLFGVQIDSLGVGLELSSPVADQVDVVAERVAEELGLCQSH